MSICALFKNVAERKITDFGEFESYIITREKEKHLIAWHNSMIMEDDQVNEILC